MTIVIHILALVNPFFPASLGANGVAERRAEAAGLLPSPPQEPSRRSGVRSSHLLAGLPH